MALKKPTESKDTQATEKVATAAEAPETKETPAEPVAKDPVAQAPEPALVNSVAPEPEVAKTPSAIEADDVSAEAKASQVSKELQEQAEAKGKGPAKTITLVEVKNLKGVSFRQPSTGTWIDEYGTAHLLDDGWLANQVKAKLLEKVE